MSANPKSTEQITIDYYNQNADSFIARNLDRNLEHLYRLFLALLPPGARILDAGCGWGRDSLNFQQRGYRVTAFDASQELVKRASELTGQPVLHMKFNQVSFQQEFDAIWACASLLHVPKNEIDGVLHRLSRALVPGGVMFVSFRYGDREEVRDGRLFSDYTEQTFAALVSNHPELAIIESWQRVDELRPNTIWMQGLLRKGD